MLSRLMTRREQFVLSAVAAAMLVGSAALVVARVWRADPEVLPKNESPATVETVSKAPVPKTVPTGTAPEMAIAPTPPPPSTPETPAGVPAVPPSTEPMIREISVAVRGEVRRPGLYTFDGAARVQELLRAAGGATEKADLTDINLAARLLDGTTLVVPALQASGMVGGKLVVRRAKGAGSANPPQYTVSGWRPEVAEPEVATPDAKQGESATPAESSPDDGRINLRTATQDQLETLPGIGPKLASEIIRYRDQAGFGSVDDLDNVSGIGPKRLEAIRPLVAVR